MNHAVPNTDSLESPAVAPKRMVRVECPAAAGTPVRLFRRKGRGAAVMLILFTLTAASIIGCGGSKNAERYEAERSLYNARKMRDDVFRGSIREPFLERAMQSYRDVVSVYRGRMAEVEGLGLIVVTAQMELAELEFRTGRLAEALGDFDIAIDLAVDVPPARANALYSCGVINEELRNPEGAIAYYERFAGDYLTDARLSETARMNMRYITIPIQLAGIYRSIGNEEKAASWLGRSEEIYRLMIESEENEGIRKEVSYNLLTVYLQGRRWKRAIEHIEGLEKTYGEDQNRPSLVFIRATIEKEGFGNADGAYDIYMSVYDTYPKSAEAPRALLAAADIRFNEKRYEAAKKIYRKVIDEYAGSAPEVVQAEWQTARLLEASGDWHGASLKYKEIYQNYPNTEQGLQSPLMVIRNYRNKNQLDAARAAYGQAVEHYEQLVTDQGPAVVKILAESHLVTAHADMEEWEKAADLLLSLPEKYPGYPRFRENYLTAASIYEKELGDGKRAAEALRICMERYPGSPLAAEAEKRYRRLEEQK
jgi:tetratricopeptide (TPR) repeat protein